MTIYLYVKTHQTTGLKYLGKTTASNPYKYTGSGVYWVSHLEKHGYNFDTTILHECQSNDEIKKLGLYYSELWDIVNSAEWANLVPENGDGGRIYKWTDEEKLAASLRNKGQLSLNKGKTYVEIYGEEKAASKIEKFKNTFSNRPKKEKPKKLPYCSDRIGVSYEELYGKEKADAIKAKQKGKLAGDKNPRYGKPGTFVGRKHTQESLAKMKKPTGPQQNPRQQLTCPHCEKTTDASNAKRWHFDNCKKLI